MLLWLLRVAERGRDKMEAFSLLLLRESENLEVMKESAKGREKEVFDHKNSSVAVLNLAPDISRVACQVACHHKTRRRLGRKMHT